MREERVTTACRQLRSLGHHAFAGAFEFWDVTTACRQLRSLGPAFLPERQLCPPKRHHCLSAIEVVRTSQLLEHIVRDYFGHHCLSAIEVVRTAPGIWRPVSRTVTTACRQLRSLGRGRQPAGVPCLLGGHHCLSAIEVVRTGELEDHDDDELMSPLPVGN